MLRNQHYSGSIQDKPTLFRSFYKWLKPGGKILITDYCKSASSPSSEFAEYIQKGGYYLHDMTAYGKVLLAVLPMTSSGFSFTDLVSTQIMC